MDNNSKNINDESSLMYVSMDKSEIEISCISKEKRNEKVEIPSFQAMIKEIWDIFADIKNLRKNFILDEYEKLNSNLRNNIRRIRKLYTLQKSSKIINKKDINKNQIQNSSNQQQSSSNHSNLNTNVHSSTGTNTHLNLRQDNNYSNNKKMGNNIFFKLNESSNLIEYKTNNDINDKRNIKETYDAVLEIVSFLLCYDDIYINYENKSAYFTLKLFLQISTLHFMEKIGKQDFILAMINKICNILCKYNKYKIKDNFIKQILDLNEKEINKIKDVFSYDSEFLEKIHKKLKGEIKKLYLDLTYKVEKVNEEKLVDKLIIGKEEELKFEFKEDINYKFNKLNYENEIIENIQKNLDDTHKLYLKEPIKKELEIFNLLINKLSKYKVPLIKKKFIDIILRNKEVFNYINENIILENVPKSVIKHYNLYPFNKNLSVFIDKYIITGKIILDELSISLKQNYSDFYDSLEKFSENCLKELLKKSKIKAKVDFKINYYHLSLFAYMIKSDLPKKEDYFNRISALFEDQANFEKFYEILGDTEGINNLYFNKENGNIILFTYENINKNFIPFLLEKKNDDDTKNKKNIITNLDLCSILSEKIFKKDSLFIILTIALKYWAIQRNIFKYDYIHRQKEIQILDDAILLYFICYFLIHKGKIDCINSQYIQKRNYNKTRKYNNIEQNEKKENDKKEEDKNEENKKEENKKDEEIKNIKNDENQININEKEPKEKISSFLQSLGELFIEFFWFIHEILKLALTENEKNQKMIVTLSLSDKKYTLKESESRDDDEKNPIVLKLIFCDMFLYEFDKRSANILKLETTRALYYLLSKSGEGLFVFDKNI